jgi:hypothetical protein
MIHWWLVSVAGRGLRWGEATALRVCDVDLARRRTCTSTAPRPRTSPRSSAATANRSEPGGELASFGMNPTVMAAAIGVGGTVIVGVAGFSVAIWNTRKTIGHAREGRVWDQRAKVYTDEIAVVHYRQTAREHRTGINLPTEQAKWDAQNYLSKYQQPSWIELEARLLAFASEPVITAVQASATAHQEAIDQAGVKQHAAGPPRSAACRQVLAASSTCRRVRRRGCRRRTRADLQY